MRSSQVSQPSQTLMHLSFLFSGAGTLMLGPTLPAFALRWQLRDSQSGLLLAAQFFGLFLGAIAVSRNLRGTLLRGYLTAAIAFLLLALTSSRGIGHVPAIFAFFLLGLGLGQITTTVNLLSARRYRETQQRSSALSLLNFTWSAGAVLSPLVGGLYLAHFNLPALLLSFSACGFTLFALVIYAVPATVQPALSQSSHPPEMRTKPLAYFFLLFFLYGGLEATVGGWLSTYTLRYTALGVAAAAYCTTTLWASFAAGRAIAAALLRSFPERAIRVSGTLLATLATISLRGVHGGLAIGVCAACVGVGIAPFFPVTFSLLVAHEPSPRQAGAATSNIALGSAVFPYLTGLISTSRGSLHTAMVTPVVIALALFALCFTPSQSRHTAPQRPH